MSANQSSLNLARIASLSATQKQRLAAKLNLTAEVRHTKLTACITLIDDQPLPVSELQAFAKQALPQQSIPQEWKQVTTLPRTAAGKLERKGLNEINWSILPDAKTSANYDEDSEDDFLDLFGESNYEAPRNDTEALLAKIWCDVLGADEISIHDEFLEVGGDSLLSIRILARIHKAGLHIDSEAFFDYPTIAGQAKAISASGEKHYEVGSTQGQFGLIPIQHWFYERIAQDLDHWNQSVLLETDSSLSFLALDRAFQQLFVHHDALRLAVEHSNSGRSTQRYLPLGNTLPVSLVDLAKTPADAHRQVIEEHAIKQNQSLCLAKGQVISATLFKTADERHNYLLLVAHHMVIDAQSWHLLLEDLSLSWEAFNQDQKPALPNKTSSFQYWAEKLNDYANSDELAKELPFWLKQTSSTTLPIQRASAVQIVANTQVFSASMDLATTDKLKRAAAGANNGGVKAYLVSALILTLLEWTERDAIAIDIEGHGRENIFDKLDVSRTLGWFTTVFPVRFAIKPHQRSSDALSVVSQTLEALPQNGIGHGLLRYIKREPALCEMANSQVCFNFLGDMVTQEDETSLVKPVASNVGHPRSSNGLRAYKLEINAKIDQGQLCLEWSYSDVEYDIHTLARLWTSYQEHLLSLIDDGIHQDDDDLFTLSDFDETEITALSKALVQPDDK